MQIGASTRRRDRSAIAGSIAIHLCALACLAILPRGSFPSEEPDERRLLASLIRIEHRASAAPAPRTARRRVAVQPAPVAPPPEIHVERATAHASHPMIVKAERAAPVPAVTDAPGDPGAAATEPPATIAVQAAPPQAAPAASTRPAVREAPATSPPVALAGMYGPFGSKYGSAPPEELVQTLRSRYPGFDIRVSIDENGHATAVEFVRGPSDTALRDELRTRLMAARYVPDERDGLYIAGTVTIKT